MFRLISCCFLALGMTALARESSELVEEGPAQAIQTFGLQVRVGGDGNVRPNRPPQPRPRYGRALLVSYSEEPSDADHVSSVDWQEPNTVFETEDNDPKSRREWQLMPVGLMYKAYLAGEKESRISSVWFSSPGRQGVVWENTLGGHVGLLRYGTTNSIKPEGWQLDLEGAAMPRIDMGHSDDLEACDFRAGLLITRRKENNAFKFGYYHLSSHLGDEYLLRNPGYNRLNYVRDSLIIGWTHHLSDNAQIYAEVADAMNHECGAKPLEFQYGIQYSPLAFGLIGAPFAAINGHTRQDFGFVTSVNAMAGWQWRGASNHTYRVGMQYYTGPALQWEFAGQKETLTGAGMWMDY